MSAGSLAAPPSPMAPPSPAAAPRFRQSLAVITHVPHWPGDGGPGAAVAYEPYVREIRVWARLFARVEVCAPRAEGPVAGSHAPYGARNVHWTPVRYSSSYERSGQLARAVQLPGLALAIAGVIRRSDVVLLRSPGHSGLIGRPIADLLGKPHVTKWAGFLGAFPQERIPRRLERRMVERSRWPVMMYGEGGGHLLSFPPALMTEAELAEAAALSASRRWSPPWQILAVGRLLDEKGFDLAIRGLGALHARHPTLPWSFTLVGDGPELEPLRRLAADVGIADRVEFAGALPFGVVQRRYGEAHVVIMPGTQEGWPKIIAEAWAHGAVPVAAAGGIVPWIMRDRAGATFAPTPDALADVLHGLLGDPAALAAAGARGPALAREISLEAFGRRVEAVLTERLGLA